jgi:hypothetical protein
MGTLLRQLRLWPATRHTRHPVREGVPWPHPVIVLWTARGSMPRRTDWLTDWLSVAKQLSSAVTWLNAQLPSRIKLRFHLIFSWFTSSKKGNLQCRYCTGTETSFIILLLSLAPQPSLGLGLLHKIRLNFLEASQQFSFLQGTVVSPTPNPISHDQASVFISPRSRVATHFSRLL